MKIKNLICLSLCAVMMTMPMMSFAAEATTVDSVGSVQADLDAADPIGKDTTQAKQSEYQEVDKGSLGDKTVNVYVSQGPTYTVKIPKTVILDGASGVDAYQVAVKGDIEGTKQITVTPYKDASTKLDASNKLVLSQAGKPDITAAVVQADTGVEDSEMQIDAYADTAKLNGTITTENLSAGSWTGNFLMRISYDDK